MNHFPRFFLSAHPKHSDELAYVITSRLIPFWLILNPFFISSEFCPQIIFVRLFVYMNLDELLLFNVFIEIINKKINI